MLVESAKSKLFSLLSKLENSSFQPDNSSINTVLRYIKIAHIPLPFKFL